MPNRERWFAELLQAGLDTRLLSEPDILVHATPAILIASLSRDVLARVFDGALAAGAISPKAVIETATIPLIAEKVPPAVVWNAIKATAERSAVSSGKPADEIGAREWLRRGLAAGLDGGVLTAGDVVRHVDAKVLSHAFPDELTTKLLEASLAAGKMNADLIVATLGTTAIAKHAPTDTLWAIFAAAGEGGKTTTAATGVTTTKLETKPRTLEFVDDDVASVLVDLEEGLDAAAKPAARPAAVTAAPAKR